MRNKLQKLFVVFIIELNCTFNFISKFKHISYWFHLVILSALAPVNLMCCIQVILFSAAFPFTVDPHGVRHQAGPRRNFREAHDTDTAGP